jgi:hypothetical protein
MPKESVPMQLLDKRVVERNIKRGLVTREAYEKHMSSLADVASQAEVIQAKLGADESASHEGDDGDEGDDEEENG